MEDKLNQNFLLIKLNSLKYLTISQLYILGHYGRRRFNSNRITKKIRRIPGQNKIIQKFHREHQKHVNEITTNEIHNLIPRSSTPSKQSCEHCDHKHRKSCCVYNGETINDAILYYLFKEGLEKPFQRKYPYYQRSISDIEDEVSDDTITKINKSPATSIFGKILSFFKTHRKQKSTTSILRMIQQNSNIESLIERIDLQFQDLCLSE